MLLIRFNVISEDEQAKRAEQKFRATHVAAVSSVFLENESCCREQESNVIVVGEADPTGNRPSVPNITINK